MAAEETGLPLLLHVRGASSEVASVANGAAITPALAPDGISGRLLVRGRGTVEYTPAGVSFGLGYQQRDDSAYYQFTGAGIGTLFNNLGPGEVSFTWTSRYSYQERMALVRTPSGERYVHRTAFQVYSDASQQFRFDVVIQDGYLAFVYKVGDGPFIYYFVPRGTEDAVFGRNVALHVRLAWDGLGQRRLYFNGAVVQSGAYTPSRASWTAPSFSIGARDAREGGGFYASDDAIADFQVRNGGLARRPPPSVDFNSLADGQSVTGVLAIRLREQPAQPLSRATLRVDGVETASILSAPFWLFWDTRRFGDGVHEVSVEVEDLFGYRAARKLSVRVSNGALIDSQPPRSIGGFRTVDVGSRNVTFQWNPAEDDGGAVSYTVYRDGAAVATVPGDAAVPAFADTGLSPASAYTYQVVAVDAAGNSSPRSSPLALSTKARDGKVLRVGPGADYALPCRAIAAAAPYDTVEIDAAGNGAYDGDVCEFAVDNLTIRGVNGRARIDAAGRISGDKAIWVVAGADNVIENVELSGAVSLSSANGAAIRLQGPGLTLRNVFFHHNQDGILTHNVPGTLLIEYSEFAYNGAGDGLTHNMYINRLDRFILRYSYSHEAIIGHLVKSRARENYILYNRLTDEGGSASYELDFPNGGLSYAVGNVIQQSAHSDNNIFVSYGLEDIPADRSSQLYLVNNTFVNDFESCVLVHLPPGAMPVVIQNNILPNCSRMAVPADRGQMVSNVVAGASAFVGAAVYDYRLAPGSPALGAGSAPVNGPDGRPVAAIYEYVDQASGRARTLRCPGGRIPDGGIDAGAVQSGDSILPPDALPCDTLDATVVASRSSSSSAGAPAGALSISPASVSLKADQQQQFTAAGPAGPDPAVRWSLSGPGALSASGLYTAPSAIASDTTAVVTASSDADPSKSASARVTLRAPENGAPRLTYAAFSPTTVAGGNTVSLSLCVSAGEPAGDVEITLASADPAILPAPAKTVLARGACGATRIVTVSPAAPTDVDLTASIGDSVVRASLRVVPVTVASLYVFPQEITGGRTSDASKVTLTAPAPAGGFAVPLASSNPALSVLESVTVPEGALSATFSFSTPVVASTTAASISAAGFSAPVVVQPPTVSYAGVSPVTVAGGKTSKLSFTINVTPASDFRVAVTSSNPDIVSLPEFVIVPAGANAASVEFSTAAVASPTPVVISIASGGSSVKTALTVVP